MHDNGEEGNIVVLERESETTDKQALPDQHSCMPLSMHQQWCDQGQLAVSQPSFLLRHQKHDPQPLIDHMQW